MKHIKIFNSETCQCKSKPIEIIDFASRSKFMCCPNCKGTKKIVREDVITLEDLAVILKPALDKLLN